MPSCITAVSAKKQRELARNQACVWRFAVRCEFYIRHASNPDGTRRKARWAMLWIGPDLRNYLLPQGGFDSFKAEHCEFRSAKAQLEARNIETKKAEDLASRLNRQTFIVIRSASDAGAFMVVTPREPQKWQLLVGLIASKLFIRPIKELGLHEMEVKIHPESCNRSECGVY